MTGNEMKSRSSTLYAALLTKTALFLVIGVIKPMSTSSLSYVYSNCGCYATWWMIYGVHGGNMVICHDSFGRDYLLPYRDADLVLDDPCVVVTVKGYCDPCTRRQGA